MAADTRWQSRDSRQGDRRAAPICLAHTLKLKTAYIVTWYRAKSFVEGEISETRKYGGLLDFDIDYISRTFGARLTEDSINGEIVRTIARQLSKNRHLRISKERMSNNLY